MKFYSDLEVEILIDDISEAAHEAIEKAAAEAARAAALAALEREAAALYEAQKWQKTAQEAKKTGVRNAVITGAVCFLGGLVVGLAINM